jgi:transposase
VRAPKPCLRCAALEVQLAAALARVGELEAEVATLRAQLREALKLIDLQRADLDRLRAERDAAPVPNHPERVPQDDLAAAYTRVVEAFAEVPAANDGTCPPPPPAAPARDPAARPRPGRARPHARRRLDQTTLAVHRVVLDPDEVVAAGGAGFRLLGEEVSERVAFAPASYFRLQLVRRTWTRVAVPVAEEPAVVTAALPPSVWPHVMADPSTIAHHILAKYGDVLPLHRQEQITARHGFAVPRSTQCGWLGAAYDVCYRVVDAMFRDAKARAFCIATDATGAPVKGVGGCVDWHVFAFLADQDHVVFRHARTHNGPTVRTLLAGYTGYLLADASAIYDVLYRDHDLIEVGCWYHCRKGYYRALGSDGPRALEALALIAKLFEIDRDTRAVPMPARTDARAVRARPVLALLDQWVARHRGAADPRGPLAAAIGYYDNQRDALRQFLIDGRLSLSNNRSEQALRNLALGRHNYLRFENATGLQWYTTFRSLIASCALHGLNPQRYLEDLLRLAPHWPVTRLLELSPKYWAATVARLDDRQRAIVTRPWELPATTVTTAPRVARRRVA